MNWQAPRGRGQHPQPNYVNYGAHPQYQPPSAAGWAGYPVNYNNPQYGNYPAYPSVDHYGQVYYQSPSPWQNVPSEYSSASTSLMQNTPPPPGEEVQASWLFKKDNKARPSKIVVVMRGLPGSGKTHLANLFKQLEIKHFGNTPRLITVDDYFMEEKQVCEVDSVTGKTVKTIKLEYNYDADLFESYKASALKQFEKTVKQGLFSFIIVDNVNSKAQDVSAYWYTAKSAGYEVYVCETETKDVKKCTSQNIHGRSEAEITAIVKEWEETPSQFAKLILGNLMNSGIFNLNEISEVEMQSDEDKEELGMDKIEELLESGTKSTRWSDGAKDKEDGGTNSENDIKQHQSKKRQRESDTAHEDEEHKHKKSKWDGINTSEGGVVKTTGNDMTTLLGAYTEDDNKAEAKKHTDANLNKKESAFVKKQREEQQQFKAKMFIQQLKERNQ